MALVLGAPGVYPAPERPDRRYEGVRLDVTAFVGIAPRGDAHRAVPVESWSAYRALFGGCEGPGSLPYAVASFFEQGGRRAYVVRVVPIDDGRASPDLARRARLALVATSSDPGSPSLEIEARNEGSWGSRLQARLTYEAKRAFSMYTTDRRVVAGLGFADLGAIGSLDKLVAAVGTQLPVGSCVRVRGGSVAEADGAVRVIVRVEEREINLEPGTSPPQPGSIVKVDLLVLDRPIPLAPPPDRPTSSFDVEVVTGVIEVESRAVDGTPADPTFPGERLPDLGLDKEHPRWIERVLRDDARSVRPVGNWDSTDVVPASGLLPALVSRVVEPGLDAYEAIDVERDFFDPKWDPADERSVVDEPTSSADQRRPWYGLHAIAEVDARQPDGDVPSRRGNRPTGGTDEIGLVVVPDLFWDGATEASPLELAPICRPTFEPCGEDPVALHQRVRKGQLLDGATPDQLQRLLARQAKVVEFADRQQRFVALLDVPARMPMTRIEQWRAQFDSSYAAGYHPWLRVNPPDDGREGLVDLPPSAAAAGIIASREQRSGVAWGAANEIVKGGPLLAEPIDDAQHDRLHVQGVNVFRQERQGVRLSAARTLSNDRQWRQLSVRRLMLLLRLTLLRESLWMAFEPNNEMLRLSVRWQVTAFLRQLYLGGAFRGASEAEAYFVNCDARLNPRQVLDRGQLLVEVGVAPAEPLEYLVLRVVRENSGQITLEDSRA